MKVTFETAAFADSIKKAAIVAPGHGAAYDKCNGIVLELDESGSAGWNVLVRSTNLDIFRIEWLDPESIEGGTTSWRLPAALFAKVIGSLPIGPGKSVTLEEGRNGLQRFVRVTQGRTKARFNLIESEYYPDWPIFDPTRLSHALDLGARISQVEWAADNSQPPLSGIHFDGERVIATDRYRMAAVPLEVPGLVEPITIPAGLLSQLLRQTGEISLGVDGGQLLIMPDDSIQIRCILFGVPYPGTAKIRERTYPNRITVKKTPLLEILSRAQSYGATDRDSVMKVFIGEEEIAVFMSNQEVGVFGDAIEIPGQALHDRIAINFTPKNIIDPLTNAPSEEVIIDYDAGKTDGLIRIDGGSGYTAWGQPRRDSKPSEGT